MIVMYFRFIKLKNMTTLEILAAFLKGREIAGISDKQRTWLINQARKEGFQITGNNEYIYFNDCFYHIKQCKRMASGGSCVGTRVIQGRYNLEKLYSIKFTDTGHTCVGARVDLNHYESEGCKFEIINPKP